MRTTSLVLLQLFLAFSLNAQAPGQQGDRVLLPNGWWLSPAGEQVRLGDFPTNAALSEDGSFLAVLHSGQSKAQVMLVDMKEKKVTQSIRLKDAWQGIAFQGSTLFVSGGYQNCVYTFTLDHGTLSSKDTIRLIDPKTKKVGNAAGLDLHENTLAIVFRGTVLFATMISKRKSKPSYGWTACPIRARSMPRVCSLSRSGPRKGRGF